MTGRREDGFLPTMITINWADHTKYQPHQKYVYVIQTYGSGHYVAKTGYCSHWDGAMQFRSHGDAKEFLNQRKQQLDEEGFHPDSAVMRLKIIRLTIAVTQAKVFD